MSNHNFFNNETDFWTIAKDELLLPYVVGKTILEVGCGAGTFLQKLHDRGKQVEGIDFSTEAVQKCRRKLNKKVNVICADATTYCFNKKYDTVILSGIIEHIKNDKGFIAKMAEITKKRIIVLTSAYSVLYSEFDKSVHHYRRYDKKVLVALMESAGYKIREIRYWDVLGMPYLLITKIFKRKPITPKKLEQGIANALLTKWFTHVENKLRPPFGLNLIIIAEPPHVYEDSTTHF